jgi:asparagine synthase (glutamine-hydrolysing)
MNAAMAARGADEYRTYTDFLTGVSLGARRLTVSDTGGGRQPVTNEDGTVWTVLDGKVGNHLELRQALFARGHRFASRVDTEVLVHLYEESGVAMVRALQGVCAFALWDARRKELLVVRDRFGKKPLFYAEQGSDLFFASELDVLLAGMEGTPQVEQASIDREVAQVPPGHVLRWERRRACVTVDSYVTPTSEAELVAPDSAAA